MAMSLRAVVRHRHRLAAAARTVRAGRPASRRSSTETASKEAAGGASKEAAAPPDRVPVAPVAGAAAAAILTVMATSVAAERLTASSAPPFDPRGDRFDQATFFGRFAKMLLACDPALLLNGREEVLRCQRVVEGHAKHLEERPDGVSATEASRQIWEAQRVASSALHPDTGEFIPRPFRMSGYVPYNGPICVAMVAAQSTPALLFCSWLNQSHNAMVNYFNRNAASEMTNATLATSYAAAVGSSLTVAFGLATFVQRRYSPARAKHLMRWIAFPSSVVASSLNCYIVRSPEIDTGIPLADGDGEEVLPGETSQIAARRGVESTTLSRALLQAPVYFLPPLLMGAVPPLRNALLRHPLMTVPTTTYLLLVGFGIGLPASVAVFPQTGEIRVEEAEEKYRQLKDEKNGGKPYEVLYYNKGL